MRTPLAWLRGGARRDRGSPPAAEDAPAAGDAPGTRDPQPAASRRGPGWPTVSLVLIIAGGLIPLLYVSQVPAGRRWPALATAYGVAGAAGLIGGLVGFLFGIPRAVQRRGQAGDDPTYQDNTNLEQVSDWLSKIIVGVGLVQVGRVLPALGRLGHSLQAPLGGLPSGAAFGLATVCGWTILGFLSVYLWAREFLPPQLADVRAEMDSVVADREQTEFDALFYARRQLDAAKGGNPPGQEKLAGYFARAPRSTLLQIYWEAEDVRSRSWVDPKENITDLEREQRMERLAQTVPVFQALVAADTTREYHRFHGSLGFALKDSRVPAYREAYKNLTDAIAIRQEQNQDGWRIYEANRALCAVKLRDGLAPEDPERVRLATQADADLARTAEDSHAARMVSNSSDLRDWLEERRQPPP
jgi:hypothetical protein